MISTHPFPPSFVHRPSTKNIHSNEFRLLVAQATVLTVSPRPHLLADFWMYLTTHDAAFSTPEAQSRLSDRLRDVMLKQMTLVGAPQLLSALIPLAKVQTSGKGEETPGEMDLEEWYVFDIFCSVYCLVGPSIVVLILGRHRIPV